MTTTTTRESGRYTVLLDAQGQPVGRVWEALSGWDFTFEEQPRTRDEALRVLEFWAEVRETR